MDLRPALKGALAAMGVSAVLGAHASTLSTGKWQEVGAAAPPVVAADVALVVTAVTPGAGRAIVPGDLVKLRVNAGCPVGATVRRDAGDPTQPGVVWLWTGREPVPGPREPKWMDDAQRWGYLGSTAVRAALIGRRVGDALRIARPDKKGRHDVPLAGFIMPFDQGASLENMGSSRWPPYEIAAGAGGSAIVILAACPGKLYRREDPMTQAGWVPSLFGDGPHDFFRKDTITWSAVEGACPEGKVRFEIGPLYHRAPFAAHEKDLVNWKATYAEHRPRDRYPQEWAVRRPPEPPADCGEPAPR